MALRSRTPILASPAPPSPTGTTVWLNVQGDWKQATVWINVEGVWKVATPSLNVNGTWK